MVAEAGNCNRAGSFIFIVLHERFQSWPFASHNIPNMVVNIKFLIVFSSWQFFFSLLSRAQLLQHIPSMSYTKNRFYFCSLKLLLRAWFALHLRVQKQKSQQQQQQHLRRSSLCPILCSFSYSWIVRILSFSSELHLHVQCFYCFYIFHAYILPTECVTFCAEIRVYALFLKYVRIILNHAGQNAVRARI